MCIMKGQEGVMYAWQSHKRPNNKDMIDTLFVELANLPTPVKMDGLPQNVIPLTRTAVITNCKFMDDTSLTISRSQVEALPNFTMMDYASQGKTQPYNVVDSVQLSAKQDYRGGIWSTASRISGARAIG